MQVRKQLTEELRTVSRSEVTANKGDSLDLSVSQSKYSNIPIGNKPVVKGLADKPVEATPVEATLGGTPLADGLEAQPSLPYNTESLSTSSQTGRLSISTKNRGPRTAESSLRIRRGVADGPELTSSVIRPTRYGRVPKRTVFPDSIIQYTEANTVHIYKEETTLDKVLTDQFGTISIQEAMKEDAPK